MISLLTACNFNLVAREMESFEFAVGIPLSRSLIHSIDLNFPYMIERESGTSWARLTLRPNYRSRKYALYSNWCRPFLSCPTSASNIRTSPAHAFEGSTVVISTIGSFSNTNKKLGSEKFAQM